MKKMILGYVTDSALPGVTEKDAKMLTHINIAFGLVKNGLADISHLRHLDCLKRIREWNSDIKLVLSIGGWGAGGFSNMALTEEGRDAFCESCKRICDECELDGIDIDWEYPCSDSANIDADPRDKQTFTLLLRGLRKALGSRIVSIAAGAGDYFIRDTEMHLVQEPLDYVQLMTYDMRSGFCKEAGHHTALYPSDKGDPRKTTTETVEAFHKAGVPYEKLVIGAAFYARLWTNVPSDDYGLFMQTENVAGFGPGFGELKRDYIGKNGWTDCWDDSAKAPWLYKDGTFLSYDNEASVTAKYEYLVKKGLLGIMYWEHGCDDTRTLLGAIYSALNEEA